MPDGSPYVRGAGRSADPAVVGSAVGVARTAAVADRAGALLPGRAVRSEHLDHGHGAVPELLVEAAYDGGREQLQLGRPGGRVGADDAAGRRRTTRACSARRPRRRPAPAQRPKTPCTRRSRSQPWSATSRPTVVSRVCGSRSSGCAPATRPRARRFERVRAASGPLARARPARTPGSAPGPGRARRRGARARRVGRGARRVVGLVSHRRSLRTSPSRDGVPDPGQRLRHVGADRGGDQHLLGAGHQVGELRRAARCRARRRRRRGSGSGRRRRRAAGRTTRASARARTTSDSPCEA